MRFLGGQIEVFSNVVIQFQPLDMTTEGLWELFEGDFADTYARKSPIVLMRDEITRQECTDVEQGPPWAQVKIYYIFPIPIHFF